MSFTDDPIRDFEKHDAEQERWLQSRPVCSECGEHIQDEELFDIDGDLVCEECLTDYMKKHYNGTYKLLELICEKCGLVLYSDCQVIDSDGRDEACEFVLTRDSYENRDKF